MHIFFNCTFFTVIGTETFKMPAELEAICLLGDLPRDFHRLHYHVHEFNILLRH